MMSAVALGFDEELTKGVKMIEELHNLRCQNRELTEDRDMWKGLWDVGYDERTMLKQEIDANRKLISQLFDKLDELGHENEQLSNEVHRLQGIIWRM